MDLKNNDAATGDQLAVDDIGPSNEDPAGNSDNASKPDNSDGPENPQKRKVYNKVLMGKFQAFALVTILYVTVLSAFAATMPSSQSARFRVALSDPIFSLAFPMLLISVYALLLFLALRTSSTSFLDIDDLKSSTSKKRQTITNAADVVRVIQAATDGIEVKIEPVTKEAVRREMKEKLASLSVGGGPIYDRFEKFIREVLSGLDEQIELSERKASLLLQKGTIFLISGVLFYVFTILLWQFSGAGMFSGLQGAIGPIKVIASDSVTVDNVTSAVAEPQLSTLRIIGMVSCSLTFLVVEFLAAWFLRQYRSFVDAGAQLQRVKSSYDRFYLSYIAVKEFSQDDAAGLAKMRSEMLKVLSVDIKWPEATKTSAADYNHMVELFDSLGKFLDKVKPVTKPKNDEKPGS